MKEPAWFEEGDREGDKRLSKNRRPASTRDNRRGEGWILGALLPHSLLHTGLSLSSSSLLPGRDSDHLTYSQSPSWAHY